MSDVPGAVTPPRRPAWRAWARYLVSLGLIAYLLTKVEFAPLLSLLGRASLPLMGLAFVMILLDQAVTTLAWNRMLRANGYRIPFTGSFRVTLMADFLGMALPSSMGADVVRIAGLSRYISNTTLALSSFVAFRVMGLGQTVLLAALTSLIFASHFPDATLIHAAQTALFIMLAGGVLGLIFANRALKLAERYFTGGRFDGAVKKGRMLYETFLFYFSHRDALISGFSGALYVQLSKIVSVYVVALALHLEVSPAAFFLFVPVINIITLLPVSIAGLGMREGGYVALFGYLGLSTGEALSLSLLVFGINMLFVLCGGIIYWVFGFPNSDALEKVGEVAHAMDEAPAKE